MNNHKKYHPRSIVCIRLCKSNFIGIVFGIFLFIGITGCKKFVDVDAPKTQITSANVYTTDATATAVLTGIYTQLSRNGFASLGNLNSLSYIGSLSADDLSVFGSNADVAPYYVNGLNSNVPGYLTYWNSCYGILYQINAAIEGLTASNTLSPAVKKQLLGEAQFMRAFYYFYLTNLYGGVPLVLSTDYKANAILPRTSPSQVYDQVIADLKEAQQNLAANYLDGTLSKTTTERVSPTSWAATALLARAYLYEKKWNLAEAQATAVINNSNLFSLPSLDSTFLRNNRGAIWQLQTVISAGLTWEATVFILPAGGPSSGQVYLNNLLVNAFETSDLRKSKWLGNVTVGADTYYFPYKYKDITPHTSLSDVTEYETVFRIAEQYLIRSEARAQQGNIPGAQSDLNVIRTNTGLPNTTANSQATLLNVIAHERQVELFTEWGHRWLDLKRTGTVDAVMGAPENACAAKGGTWNSYQALYPIPFSEMQLNQNLVQNPGY